MISKQPTHCSKLKGLINESLLPVGEPLSTSILPDPSHHLYQSQFTQEQELAEIGTKSFCFQERLKTANTCPCILENFGQVGTRVYR